MISLERLLFSTYRKLKVPLRRLRSEFQAKQPSDLLTEQEESFRNLGLVRDVDAVISNFPSLKSLASQGLVSEHYPLFASIAASGFYPQTILEIGTFDGAFTRFMSLIFPYAAITTYDLPLEEGFEQEYGRADQEKYVSERSKNIDDVANVTLVERNSVSLTLDSVSRFDAIWVDGDHGYPVATMDITNAIRLLTPGGYLVIDDVFVDVVEADEKLRSLSSYQTLQAALVGGIIKEFNLVKKRISPHHNLPWRQKYIAVARKH